MNFRHAAGALCCCAALGCRGAASYDSPSSRLERGISFVESDEASRLHPISNPDLESRVVSRVPKNWPIDINSSVKLRVQRSQLAGTEQSEQWLGTIEELAETWGTFTPIIEDLQTYVEFLPEVHEAYLRSQAEGVSSLAHDTFLEKRRRLAGIEGRVTDALLGAGLSEDEMTLIEESAGDFSGLLLHLERANDRHRALTAEIGYKLRLEAFLLSSGSDPEALHLAGYDTLAEGRLQPLDRWGIRLQGKDLERFKEMNAEARRIADAGNRYLDGKADAEEAFRLLSDSTLEPIFTLAADVTALAREFEFEALARRSQRSDAALKVLSESLQAASTELTEQSLASFLEAIASLEDELMRSFETKLGLPQLLIDVQQVRVMIANLRFDDVPEILLLVDNLVERTKGIAKSGDRFSADARERSMVAFDALVADIEDETTARLTALWNNSNAQIEFNGWVALADRVKGVGDRGEEILEQFQRGSTSLPLVPAEFPLPSVIDVALIDAPDAEVDLQRSGRRDGDTLRVRATLVDSDTASAPYTRDFAVTWLGWHARLDPSVILAKPTSGLQGEADFRFSTAVSWLWAYDPRPDEDEWYHEAMRFTDLAIGPHASLLPFNPDKDVEVGLGVTVSLWNGVLQGGVGFNLMAGGDVYVFVGSSLISLVQAVGNELPRSSANSVTPGR